MGPFWKAATLAGTLAAFAACSKGGSSASNASPCPAARPDACGTGASAFCTDFGTDPTNCGTCGHACGVGRSCSAGVCTLPCAAPQTACPTANPTYCADLASDANNCGGCGATCPAGQLCSGGACASPPPPRLVDLRWDASHDRGVNQAGGGYLVDISGKGTIDVPYVTGAFAPTTVSTTLSSGIYTVTVRAYAALDAAGGMTGSKSAPAQINLVVP
jgi:hypothetical protein